MSYAMVYAGNGDIIGMYTSREDALRQLGVFIDRNPEVQDEVGLRLYENGRPAGAYEGAVDVLGQRVTHQHLI